MIKYTKSSVFKFLLLKNLIFFLILAFKGNRFEKLVIDRSESSSELMRNSMGYIFWVTLFSLLLTILFAIPVYFSLKIKQSVYFYFLMFLLISLDYFIYLYFTSQAYFRDINGMYIAIIDIIFLYFIHRRSKVR